MPRPMSTSGEGMPLRSASQAPARTAATIASSPMAISTGSSCTTGHFGVREAHSPVAGRRGTCDDGATRRVG